MKFGSAKVSFINDFVLKKINKSFPESDIVPFLVTLLACLFLGLEYGMILGIGVNLIFILITSARPYVLFEMEKVSHMEVLTVAVHSDLKYSAAEYLKDLIFSYVVRHPELDIVVLKGEEIFSIDSTVGLVGFGRFIAKLLLKICIF